MKERILVTGGAGFLGSHIADELSNRGYDVTLLDIHPSPYLRPDQSEITTNILNLSELVEALKGFDYVYHLAALADLNAAKERPLDTVTVNILGTVNILEACRINRIKRLIFGSTVYVYSREGGFYRCSKQACESYIEEYSLRYGLEYTVLRFGSLYGPRTDMANGVYRLLYRFMRENKVEYSGKSSDKRDYIHVYDAARLSANILGPEFVNKHFTLTGNDRMEVRELFSMFSEMLERKVEVVFLGDETPSNGHYNLTPYTFTPKIGKKLVSNEYVDLGQGLLELMEEIHNREKNEET